MQPAVEAEGSGDAAVDPAVPPAERWADHWSGLVRDLIRAERISALPRELAWNAQCIDWEYEPGASTMHCVLRVEREMLRAPQHCEKLRGALAEHLGLNVDLRVEPGAVQHTPAIRFLEEKKRRQREAERVIQEDPLVRSLLEQFTSARIVPGSVHPRSAA
jgi:DNA polymerase-3 subunit gamma/tau